MILLSFRAFLRYLFRDQSPANAKSTCKKARQISRHRPLATITNAQFYSFQAHEKPKFAENSLSFAQICKAAPKQSHKSTTTLNAMRKILANFGKAKICFKFVRKFACEFLGFCYEFWLEFVKFAFKSPAKLLYCVLFFSIFISGLI